MTQKIEIAAASFQVALSCNKDKVRHDGDRLPQNSNLAHSMTVIPGQKYGDLEKSLVSRSHPALDVLKMRDDDEGRGTSAEWSMETK